MDFLFGTQVRESMNPNAEFKVGYLVNYLNLPSVSTINRQKAQ
jgi:hypothetical protein